MQEQVSRHFEIVSRRTIRRFNLQNDFVAFATEFHRLYSMIWTVQPTRGLRLIVFGRSRSCFVTSAAWDSGVIELTVRSMIVGQPLCPNFGFKMTITVDDETVGFEPLVMGVYYQEKRQHDYIAP